MAPDMYDLRGLLRAGLDYVARTVTPAHYPLRQRTFHAY